MSLVNHQNPFFLSFLVPEASMKEENLWVYRFMARDLKRLLIFL